MKVDNYLVIALLLCGAGSALGAGNTINYVWIPAGNVKFQKLEFINNVGSRTGVVNFPTKSGTAGFYSRIYDCSVSDWSGKWDKETYTYLAVPQVFPTAIGNINIRTTYSDSTYQWIEDGRSVSYWQVASVKDMEFLGDSCAKYGDLGVMDFKFGAAKIELTVPTLPWAGELNVDVPVYAANMEHWWNTSRGGNPNWEYGYTQFKHLLDVAWYIPVTIKAYTNCRLSASNINIDYGAIDLNKARSGVENQVMLVSCALIQVT